MTKTRVDPDTERCTWCRRALPTRAGGPGRTRLHCSQRCRQAAYMQRVRREQAGLSEAELIVTRAQLDALYDQLFVLEAAIGDVARDMAAARTRKDVVEALEWLLEAARPLVQLRLDA